MLPHDSSTTVNNFENSHLETLGHRITLDVHGATWEATIMSLTNHGLFMNVEGFIPVTPSQGVKFTLSSQHSILEIKGKVAGVTIGNTKQQESENVLGHMQIQVTWPDLDEMTAFKLKGLVKTLSGPTPFPHIELSFLTESAGEERHEHIAKSFLIPPTNLDLPELSKASQPKLLSTVIQCLNPSGKKILGYLDHREGIEPHAPVVVLTPGYGETKREYITLAYYLACNGFHVLRYDHTSHVGESEGDHEHTSLTNMKLDMNAMIDFAKHNWMHSRIGLVATSLAGRVALKALSQGTQVDQLIVISGIVDVRATLAAVHQEDLIGDYLNGNGRGITNVLGFNVDGNVFLRDTVDEGFSELSSTIEDAQGIQTPVIWFAPEEDAWVNQESHQQVMESFPSPQSRSFSIPEGLHRLQENPRRARAVYRQIVFACQEQLVGHPETHELMEPSRKDIGLQTRIERERNQTRRFQHEADHVDFWNHYLSNFHYIANSHDYLAALDHIYHLLGPVSPGDRLLDAGCGNGHFGSFLFAKEWTRRQQAPHQSVSPIHYTGVDFVETALTQAKSHLSQVLRDADEEYSHCQNPSTLLTPNFYRLDLNKPLPFKDGNFDRIMSNLVIGYLRDPAATIRELLRVLAPGGKMVLTNLKPCSDLTQIYRNFVDRTTTTSAIHEAREVLNNSSHIRQGESEGAFQFYSQDEFLQVLQGCGADNPKVFPTFGNQAYIGIVEKLALPSNELAALPLTPDSLIAA
ncbi:MAG: alpha/beta hydrolase [Nitrospirae bacterium]|nr:alpha/beta hydrolase [Nitrospirota bacterium]MDA1303419.1 alpha/beta hydrolase [Nitrospirota bacterium]